MVDQNARDIAANLLTEFFNVYVSNEEYESRYPESESDPALSEIFLQVWFHYSDVREHKLTGKDELTAENRATVERCILFLTSDFEYQWPRQQIGLWHTLLRFMHLEKQVGKDTHGDVKVWPFLESSQYKRTSREVSSYE